MAGKQNLIAIKFLVPAVLFRQPLKGYERTGNDGRSCPYRNTYSKHCSANSHCCPLQSMIAPVTRKFSQICELKAGCQQGTYSGERPEQPLG